MTKFFRMEDSDDTIVSVNTENIRFIWKWQKDSEHYLIKIRCVDNGDTLILEYKSSQKRDIKYKEISEYLLKLEDSQKTSKEIKL